MNEICEVVPSQKGNNKINVRGYLMVKERNREDIFYWCCEKRKSDNCKGRATTTLVNGSHYLRKFNDHSHAPQASDAEVAKVVAQIKLQAQESTDQPAQIIHNNLTKTSEEIYPYIPSQNALRMKIKRVRSANMPSESPNLDEINVPISLCYTLSGELFLVKDSKIGDGRILLFTTKANIQYLSQSSFWIVDRLFKRASNTFCQLCSIHAPVGAEDNCRILPLVYGLMNGRSKELYQSLFKVLIEFAEENEIQLKPSKIISYFEKTAIDALYEVFPGVINKGCFFYLVQDGWKKIQDCGLEVEYGTNENLSLMLRHLFALAFLPSNEIPMAFDTLKSRMPPETNNVVQWFEENYVHGEMQQQLQNENVTHTSPPLFPPHLWSVHGSLELDILRKQHYAEDWFIRWGRLVSQTHVGAHTIIKEFQKEQKQVELKVESILRGEPRPKPKQKIIDRENRIRAIIIDRSNRSLMDFLRGIAHNLLL
ncbi:hypothetical protein RclHR1_28100001 [Rhizophagus clarus]|uniref:Uncharacterized protein LOC112591534 n=1 Tax=Rhizophagus clarus TaxID=94130 RepID=A0A2Z6RH50_9GLOM|nr:hypothetical protein RclHR1_28100001 [Rhizophagus clarus]GES73148.1 uncharacterized protein LOC112591534 [Rhizophagus clarus]